MANQDNSNKNVSLSLIAEYGASDSESDADVSNNADSDGSELSEMVLKNNIINACAHGPLHPADDDDDDENSVRHMIIDPQSENGYEEAVYREDVSDSDESASSSDSDSEVDSVKDVEEVQSSGPPFKPQEDKHRDEGTGNKPAKPEAPKVNGEIGLEDLPPIEDLAISLPAKETLKIGVVYSIVEQLVVVKATPGIPAVDLESILFLDNGAKALGKVFDVFGPVTEPHYTVRFNSHQHVLDRGVAVGAEVYVAPESDLTSYVFLPDLMKMKGSDASWKNDIEPPASQVEFSDDEEERRAKREAKNKHNEQTEDGETSKNPRKVQQRNQRPFESSSRFGSGPSRGRNPFTAGSHRRNLNPSQRYTRPWNVDTDVRTPPHHPNDLTYHPNFPYIYGPFNPNSPAPPPPFMYTNFARMSAPMPHMGLMRPNAPIFGSNFCSMPGSQPQWVSSDPPPPPGT